PIPPPTPPSWMIPANVVLEEDPDTSVLLPKDTKPDPAKLGTVADVVTWLMSSVPSAVSVPLFDRAPLPLSASVPALIVVPPVYVLVPERVKVPMPTLVKEAPDPPPRPPSLIVPENVVKTDVPTVSAF